MADDCPSSQMQTSRAARIVELEKMIADSHAHWLNLAKTGPTSPERPTQPKVGKWAGMQHAGECENWRKELAILKAPIVGMCVYDGRVLVATAAGLFELKGDEMHIIPLYVARAA